LVQDIDLTFKDMRLFLLLVLGLLGIALVFYLSWLPQPRLSLTWFMPHWLAAWADAPSHNTVRTGVPFIFLGLLAGGWLSLAAYPRGSWLVCWLGLIGVAILAELGQLFLPYRIFDWWDVAWGATGAMVGLTVSATMVNLLKAFLGDRR
jgi:VanZ family protein